MPPVARPSKAFILSEIKRTAENGRALGRQRFASETGIREHDWSGVYWSKWGDAVREAGLEARELQQALGDDELLGNLADLTRELGAFPTHAQVRLARQRDPTFPSHGTFARYGTRRELALRLAAWSATHEGYEDVLTVVGLHAESAAPREAPPRESTVEFGSVYLLKSGRYYKVGRTNALGRREREITLQLPERATTLHFIQTDDPVGIERYWHRRFADRRKNGEWFELTPEDVAAFRRRKFM